MANPTRPTRSSSVRLARDRPQARSTAKHDENSRNSIINNNYASNHIVLINGDPPISTRRSSRPTPLSNISNDEIVVAKSSPAPHPPAQTSRRNPRKRPAAALSTNTPEEQHRPPTKLSVVQPHDKLIQTTNGVQTVLPIPEHVSSPDLAVPNQNGAPAGLNVPAGGTQGQDRRSLRSHDGGSRLKSDLSIYFANYEDIIGDVPKPREFLDLDTPIYIVDEPLKTTEPLPNHNHTTAPSPRLPASPNRSRKSRPLTPQSTHAPPPSSTTFQVLNYSTIAKHMKDGEEDPLTDSVYFAPHRRAERKEKQLRNIEKERAMHEKAQLERLLDGLQGHDWLKVMGITGVTDGERRDWEPKRAYFVKEVQALVDKFRLWREEEKRLKVERLHKQQREARSTESDSVVSTAARSSTMEQQLPQQQDHRVSPPVRKPKRPPRPHGFILPVAPPGPSTPFVSFYSKPHLREAALGKHRHGRKVTAFGVPVPDFEEHEFALPPEYITPDALRAHARKRRRLKRESAVEAK